MGSSQVRLPGTLYMDFNIPEGREASLKKIYIKYSIVWRGEGSEMNGGPDPIEKC